MPPPLRPLEPGYHSANLRGKDDLVYVSDYLRGLDVIKITGGGRGAPTTAEGGNDALRVKPAPIAFTGSEDFGYACPVPTLLK